MRPIWTSEIQPDFAAIRAAALDFRTWASNHASPKAVADCELAFVEACNNLVQHTSTRHPIKLTGEASLNEIRLLIWDKTPGFDWPAHRELPEAEAETGRGIYLIHSVMTRVEYSRNAGWNELRLIRNF